MALSGELACGVAGSSFSAFPSGSRGDDKVDESKAFASAADAYHEATATIPDQVLRAGPGNIDQVLSNTFGEERPGPRIGVGQTEREEVTGAGPEC
jgi:hypothetical protein